MKKQNVARVDSAVGACAGHCARVCTDHPRSLINQLLGLNGNWALHGGAACGSNLKEHQKELPPGVNIEFLIRDDTPPTRQSSRRS